MTSIRKQFESLCSFSSVTFLRQKNTLLVWKYRNYFFHLSGKKDTLLVWQSYLFTRFIPWLVRLRWMSTSKPEGWRWEPKASGRHLERKTIVSLGYEALRFLGHYLPISCKTVAMMETSLRIIFTKSTFFLKIPTFALVSALYRGCWWSRRDRASSCSSGSTGRHPCLS